VVVVVERGLLVVVVVERGLVVVVVGRSVVVVVVVVGGIMTRSRTGGPGGRPSRIRDPRSTASPKGVTAPSAVATQ
jgi:hypothetical protein